MRYSVYGISSTGTDLTEWVAYLLDDDYSAISFLDFYFYSIFYYL